MPDKSAKLSAVAFFGLPWRTETAISMVAATLVFVSCCSDIHAVDFAFDMGELAAAKKQGKQNDAKKWVFFHCCKMVNV